MIKMFKSLKITNIVHKIVARIHAIFLSYIRYFRNRYTLRKKQLKISKNEKIIILYFVEDHSIFKLSQVYKLFMKDSKFEQYVFVTPIMNFEESYRHMKMIDTYIQFKNEGYNVINSYNQTTGGYIDINKEIKPDIVFFSRPYNDNIHKRYSVKELKYSLNCFMNYGPSIDVLTSKPIYRSLVSNLTWAHFVDSQLNFDLVKKYSFIGGRNVVISGYAGCDELKYNYIDNSKWGFNDKRKKIIWAPHHSIGLKDRFQYSNFLFFYEEMLELSKEFEDDILMAFKPHPSLRYKLYKHKNWGKERTDDYYDRWKNGRNTILVEGSYTKLFNSSHALIHDSVSFIMEYLYTGKPSLFIDRGDAELSLNKFGKQCLKHSYIGNSTDDLLSFVNMIVNESDYMKNDRDLFFNENIRPKDKSTSSEYIYEYIVYKLQRSENESVF